MSETLPNSDVVRSFLSDGVVPPGDVKKAIKTIHFHLFPPFFPPYFSPLPHTPPKPAPPIPPLFLPAFVDQRPTDSALGTDGQFGDCRSGDAMSIQSADERISTGEVAAEGVAEVVTTTTRGGGERTQ